MDIADKFYEKRAIEALQRLWYEWLFTNEAIDNESTRMYLEEWVWPMLWCKSNIARLLDQYQRKKMYYTKSLAL